MLNFIDEILTQFKDCFSRRAAFGWFVILVCGFLIRSDTLGITSVIRDLALNGKCYETMNLFFRADSWKLENIRNTWYKIVQKHAPIMTYNGYTVLVGDGVKQSKEGEHMPGVKKMVQESENSSKPDFIFGHMFGGIGVLAGSVKHVCIPLYLNLHDGIAQIRAWQSNLTVPCSHVVQMVENSFHATEIFGNCIILLDRYFLSANALKRLKELHGEHPERVLHIVTRAKRNCVAWQHPEPKSGRGRKPLKGAQVKLMTLFDSCPEKFQDTNVVLYGKKEHIRYLSTNLLWGTGLYQELKFVLVEMNGHRSIFVTTDTQMDAIKILELYGYRFSIESLFRVLKQNMGGFSYHFWSKAMPKLNRYKRKDAPDVLETITDEAERKKIAQTVRATEMYVMIACIATGILQMISMNFSTKIPSATYRYLRTQDDGWASEATVQYYLQKHFFRFMMLNPELSITRIIKHKQENPWDYGDLKVS